MWPPDFTRTRSADGQTDRNSKKLPHFALRTIVSHAFKPARADACFRIHFRTVLTLTSATMTIWHKMPKSQLDFFWWDESASPWFP
jgi:hypothetical protein